MSKRPTKLIVLIAACLGSASATYGVAAQAGDLTFVVPLSNWPRNAPIVASVMPVGPSQIRIDDPVHFRAVSTQFGYSSLYAVGALGHVQARAENLRLHAGRPLEITMAGFTVLKTAPGSDEILIFVAKQDRFMGFSSGMTVTRLACLTVLLEGLSLTSYDTHV